MKKKTTPISKTKAYGMFKKVKDPVKFIRDMREERERRLYGNDISVKPLKLINT